MFSFKSVRWVLRCEPEEAGIRLKFGNVGFWGESKTKLPREIPSKQGNKTNNKLKAHITPDWNGTRVSWRSDVQGRELNQSKFTQSK